MKIAKPVADILEQLNQAGYQAYVVGGCVRDLLMKKEPKDWDITTDAKPEQIQALFVDSFYENTFGTVGVKTRSEVPGLEVVEVTTFRTESKYTDKRHPDEVSFTTKLEEDLGRRDFTINALAMDAQGKIVDLFDGQQDLAARHVRAVGMAEERFDEDALRMMRAVRFATSLHFDIEHHTMEAIKIKHQFLKEISQERIRDELIKIIDTDEADRGMELLRQSGLMQYVLPELLEGVGVGQNKHHIYNVWEHNVLALKYSCDQQYSTAVRLASLLHDVGKPRSKRGNGIDSTFYNHEMIGAKMTAKALERLKFPHDLADKITKLVRWHLFYYNVDEVTESSVRRLVSHIGAESVGDLIKVREADRIGSGVPKAKPYKLRHLEFMIDKVARDPISPKMLKINGSDIMELLGVEPGPKVGMIIAALMNEVLDDPTLNTREYLEKRAGELAAMDTTELDTLSQKGKLKTAEEEEKEVEKIKDKHFV